MEKSSNTPTPAPAHKPAVPSTVPATSTVAKNSADLPKAQVTKLKGE